MAEKKSKNFTGQIGFVLAAAGSAVGLGNIWRFPYLAAQDGLLFIVLYIVLLLTIGFSLLITDITIGRKTRKSSIYAYDAISSKWKYLGILTFLVPALIMMYYPVIGGWILRYIGVYLTGQQEAAAQSAFFTSFISSSVSPTVYALIFMGLSGIVIYRGVQKGIEKISFWLMPLMFIMLVGIAIYALTLEYHGPNGEVRTGFEGLVYLLTPKSEPLTLTRFLQVLLDAMGQLFFSLSISMGIMISYGSYVNQEVNLSKCVLQIEIFDTLAAFLAAIIIIPTIYAFVGPDGMKAGPSLMFISLPKIFNAMGTPGIFMGAAFFIMTTFAALTSNISVLEPIVANCMDHFKSERKKTTVWTTLIYLVLVTIVVLGYSVFYMEVHLPNGSVGQLLDIADYLATALFMPVVSLLTCILIGWVVGPKWIADEIASCGNTFKTAKTYRVMIRYIAPVILVIIFFQSTGLLSKFFG